MDDIKLYYKEFDEEYPGFLEFLNLLQPDNIIYFHQLKFGEEPKDIHIRIMYREEIGVRMRCPGVGCIEYASLDSNLKFKDMHKDGYFPCQTFISLRDWFKHSDYYEVITDQEGKLSPIK